MLEIKQKLTSYPAPNFLGVINYQGKLSLSVGKEVFYIQEYKLEQASQFSATIPQDWKRIEVSLSGVARTILVPERIYQKLSQEAEIASVIQQLQSIYEELLGTSSNKSFNSSRFIEIKKKIGMTSFLKDNNAIKGLLNKIRGELKNHRLYHIEKPDQSADIGIGFINGICNDFESALASSEYLSNLAGGTNVYSTYNGTEGLVYDLYKCAQGLAYKRTQPVDLLHTMWDQFFEKSSSGANFLMICHSQGAIHVRNALKDYSPELRKRIIVIAIAPGGYIDPSTCLRVYHYKASGWKDFVPTIDQSGQEKAKGTVRTLPSDPKAPSFDHTFRSPTYRVALASHLQNYLLSENGKIFPGCLIEEYFKA